ncbi:DUF4158 domain-containing protein, partial [Streptomyces sp. NPDC048527]|uniref:DUF4158 domain-containing protein n=1 Tax=Streptomyces sp. NPDC048527 TaxID=3365568 RepID=UPI00371C7C40
MASVERTAYPQFKRIISDRELAQFFTPDEAEIAWAVKRTHGRPESLLTLLVLLKSRARLGYFPGLDEVPVVVVACARATAGLPEDVTPAVEDRTAKRYRSWIREYLGLVHDPARAREIAAASMEDAAPVRASVVDLVNVALEEIVRAGLELPGFSTLDRMSVSGYELICRAKYRLKCRGGYQVLAGGWAAAHTPAVPGGAGGSGRGCAATNDRVE